jgi:hypothetical protein
LRWSFSSILCLMLMLLVAEAKNSAPAKGLEFTSSRKRPASDGRRWERLKEVVQAEVRTAAHDFLLAKGQVRQGSCAHACPCNRS